MAITSQVVGVLPIRKMMAGAETLFSATVTITSKGLNALVGTNWYWDSSTMADPAKLHSGWSGDRSRTLYTQVTFKVPMSPSGTVYANADFQQPVHAGGIIPAETPVATSRGGTIVFTVI